MKPYDVLIVGSGITGSTCAYLLKQQGKKVLVLEKQPYVGGGVRTQVEEDIIVHDEGDVVQNRVSDREVRCVFCHAVVPPKLGMIAVSNIAPISYMR